MAVGHDLTSFLTGAGKAQTEDHAVQTGLQDDHEVVTRDARHGLGLVEVAMELLLQHAVDELDLLLLAKLHRVLGFLTTTLGLALGSLGAAVTQHDGIQAQLAAALKNRSSIDSHSK